MHQRDITSAPPPTGTAAALAAAQPSSTAHDDAAASSPEPPLAAFLVMACALLFALGYAKRDKMRPLLGSHVPCKGLREALLGEDRGQQAAEEEVTSAPPL